jgi:heterotetrameric sarcosine oxidase delta subunit
MLRIECPHCGLRDENEYAFGGEAHLERPPLEASDAEWTGYLFFRRNPLGVHAERWRHARGCGQWFNLLRHTMSHEVLAVYRMGDPPPAIRDEGSPR